MKRWFFALFAMLLPTAAPAQTDVWPDPIVKEGVFVIPLWLPKFAGEGDVGSRAQRLEQIILSDLEFSGLFKIMREEPATAGVQGVANAVVVRGKVFHEGADVSFEGVVTDLGSGDFMGGKKYKVGDKDVRRVAHHFADEVVRLVTGEGGVASTQIVYTRKVGDKWELVVSDYDGYNPRVLVRQPVPLLAPRWMDGNQAVAYTSFRNGKADLFVRYLSEGQSQNLANYSGSNTAVEWTDNPGMLLASLSKDGNAEIYLLQKNGHISDRLTHNRAIDTSPCWAPNGREIVFLSDRSGSPQLYLMERERGQRAPSHLHRRLQRVAGLVAAGRPHRLFDPHGRRVPDRGDYPGWPRRAPDYQGFPQLRGPALGARRPPPGLHRAGA